MPLGNIFWLCSIFQSIENYWNILFFTYYPVLVFLFCAFSSIWHLTAGLTFISFRQKRQWTAVEFVHASMSVCACVCGIVGGGSKSLRASQSCWGTHFIDHSKSFVNLKLKGSRAGCRIYRWRAKRYHLCSPDQLGPSIFLEDASNKMTLLQLKFCSFSGFPSLFFSDVKRFKRYLHFCFI